MRSELPVKLLFASCAPEFLPRAVAAACSVDPELPLEVVSDTAPPQGRWIRYTPARPFADNLRSCRNRLRGKRVETALLVLQPLFPCWKLRLIAILTRPRRILALNENLDYFELRLLNFGPIARHIRWRAREWLDRMLRAGGPAAGLWQAIRHPRAPALYLRARAAGALLGLLKLPRQGDGPPAPISSTNRPPGISVVIPSRNGKDMLARVLPLVLRELESGEVIVIDNGSADGTADFLRRQFPSVIVVEHAAPLGFPAAINVGVRLARFSHVCLLNNDMAIGPRFFRHLLQAFEQVPNLFSANPQVFLPPGVPRQETGKAVIRSAPTLSDFPVCCDSPLPGEDLTYVLYGSSGCSLFDADRLLSLHGVDETYQPAYVEDLDLGVRAWQRGWPTVFAARAHVVHEHRATMSRLYSPEQLEYMVVSHWMLFLARTIRHRGVFAYYWRHAAARLFRAALAGNEHALRVLGETGIQGDWLPLREHTVMPDAEIFALCDGSVSVFPGAHAHSDRPVVLIASPFLPCPGRGARLYHLMRHAAAKWKQVLVSFVDRSTPAPPELLEICAEVVTVRQDDLDSPSFRAALRQTVAKWNPAIARLETTSFARYAPDCGRARTVLSAGEIPHDAWRQVDALYRDLLRNRAPR